MLAQRGAQDGHAQPQRRIHRREQQVGKDAQKLLPHRRDAQNGQPQPAYHDAHEEDHDKHHGGAGQELGVDDRVAVNGLGYQAVERALRAFAVDGVKAHRQSGERGQIGQERGERRNGAAAGGVEGQEQVFAAGERRIGDAAERAVEAGQAGENQQREHQLETRAVKMIGQLLMI